MTAPTPWRVTIPDVARTRSALHRPGVGPGNRFDHDRDGVVNVLDMTVVRANMWGLLEAPTFPAKAAEGAGVPAAVRARYRPGVWAGTTR